MANILIVRKPDRTIHQVPIENKATLMALSNRMPLEHQYSFEEMDKEEAAKLPYIDTDYVTPSEANTQLKERDKKIKELEAKLASLNANPQETVSDKIAGTQAAKNTEGDAANLGNDDKRTVKDAVKR